MKKIVIVLMLLVSTVSFTQTKLYVHPDAESYVANTKMIAILPMKVQIKLRPKQMKDLTPEQLVQMGKDESLDIQKAMYSWFLTRKKRGSMLVDVQNPTTTNALLKKEGIDIHSYDDYLPSELGEILGVETVITGTYETSKPLSDGVGVAVAVLFGAFASTNTAVMNMDFTSTTDDELVVNYNKKVRGSIGSDAQDLVNILMRKVSRRIPYTK